MRIGKLTPGVFQGLQPSRWAQWSRRLMSVVVLCASVSALVLIVKEQYVDRLLGAEPGAVAGASHAGAGLQAGGDAVMIVNPTEERRYRALSGFVANRYRVSQDVAYDLVRVAHRAGHQLQLDPLLIIAVIAIESRFNPIAESVAGAKGLMQIIPKYHGDKLEEFGGEQAVYDPHANIQVGAQILKEYLRTTGHLGSALQMYAGALGDGEEQYTNKVMNEKNRLQQVVSQKPAPAPVKTASARTQIQTPDQSFD